MTQLISIKTTQPNDEMNITWAPTNVCNFECRYCWPDANSGTHPPTKDLETVVKNMDHILTVYRDRLGKTKLRINFAGGEPTIWPGLETVIERLSEKHSIYWGIVTNGSRTIRWWNDFGHLFDNIQISYHIAQADLEHTIAVADMLYEKGIKVTVRIMMDSANWDRGIAALNHMKTKSKHKWFIDVAEVLEDHIPEKVIPIYQDGRVYSQGQRKFLKNQHKRIPSIFWILKNIKLLLTGKIKLYESIAYFDNGSQIKAVPNFYTNQHLNDFRGWSCNIGLERFYISWDGSIKGSCGQRLFGLDKDLNILDKDFIDTFNTPLIPSICTIPKCYCGPEMHVTKHKL
jgi:MoaA/NifB/PqqE/SkfB family radical SAM enzyme